jgi:hypothetical protein
MRAISIDEGDDAPEAGILPARDVPAASDFMESWLRGESTDRTLLDQISMPGLRILTTTVADHCNQSVRVDGMDRSDLTHCLATLLDDTFPVSTYGQNLRADEVIVSSPKPWVDADPSAVHARSQKQDQLMLGVRRTMTQQALRELRKAAGWKSKAQIQNEMGGIGACRIDQRIERIKRQKIADLTAHGMDAGEAEQHIQQEYVAVTKFWGMRKYGKVCHEGDERTSMTWVDLSPEAQRDLKALYRTEAEALGVNLDGEDYPTLTRPAVEKRGMVSLGSIVPGWMSYAPNAAEPQPKREADYALIRFGSE